jgi:hypothetical protein
MTNKTQSVLTQLVEIIQAKDQAMQTIKALGEKEAELRGVLEASMTERGIRSQVDDATNYTATLIERKDLKIIDEEAVVQALTERKALEKCLKLDTTAVKREYKAEPLAGVEEVTTSYVQLKEAS